MVEKQETIVTAEIIILAAGKGTRMRSKLPKVLHKIAGESMLGHVIDTAKNLHVDQVHVVVGHGAEQVQATIIDNVHWALQEQQLGTGHAVAQAMHRVNNESTVLIVYGDVPLVKKETLATLLAATTENSMALLTVEMENPQGYGRILRNEQQQVIAIVEQKDANEQQLLIKEVNTGIMAVKAKQLARWLPALSDNNAQGEYYLTDIIAMAVTEGVSVVAQQASSVEEVQGVNNRQQLSELERHYQIQQAETLMEKGATLADPKRIDIRGNIKIGEDVFIDVNCVFIGDVEIADGVSIGPNCIIDNSSLGENTQVKANSVIESATIADHCDIGPFARIRPQTQLQSKAKIGNFVETKKSIIGMGSKVNHLSYIGDAVIGDNANIGAGTITCNYDGVNKSKTIIGENAFIGSNSSLVAPVEIGKGATVGAGSTITNNIAEGALAVARGKQRQVDSWKRPSKK